jgi:hypothetical protein
MNMPNASWCNRKREDRHVRQPIDHSDDPGVAAGTEHISLARVAMV